MQPARLLLGRELPGKWKVVEAAARKPNATGGHFSVGYIAENQDGRKGFLKAMDYTAAFMQPAQHTWQDCSHDQNADGSEYSGW